MAGATDSKLKLRPLTPIAIETLRDLARRPAPRQEINPGLCNRLLLEALVEEVELPSPYATHKGRNIVFFQLSAAGRERLVQIDQQKGARK